MRVSLVAWSEPAGKYDPYAPLEGNEDNMFVDSDLTAIAPNVIQSDVKIPLGECGCIMAIADGMGGMNAGEVASAIATDTIKEFFAHDKISKETASDSSTKKAYLENVIKEADKRIKIEAESDPEKNGMGSTILLAWLTDSGLTISWCGDSRAYLFEPGKGLKLLSEDHSYVQELVKANKLNYEDTFNHPQGNIITRSLGDPNKVAQPETREYGVKDGDIILLCSDGLSGVLRDRKTKDKDGNIYPGENIQDIITENQDSLIECRKSLFESAEKAGWYDNVTVILCKISEGSTFTEQSINKLKFNKSLIYVVLFFILLIFSNISTGYYFYNKGIANKKTINTGDSVKYENNLRDTLLNPEIVKEISIERDNDISERTGKSGEYVDSEKDNTINKIPTSFESMDTLIGVDTELTLVESN